MKLEHLNTLYINEIRDIYSAENQLLQAIPSLIGSATHDELKLALKHHLEETRGQVGRLREIFADMKLIVDDTQCKAMQGLIRESSDILDQYDDPDIKDAALIGAAQRVEHYEMAAYGTARTFAKHLGFDRHVELLQESLDEEGAANDTLTTLAEGRWYSEGINHEAARK